MSRVKDLIFSDGVPTDDIILENENYHLYEIIDETSNNSYLEMYGSISSGDVFVMRSSLESIRNSVDLFRNFYLNVGLIMALLSIFLAFYFVRNVTKNVKKSIKIIKKYLVKLSRYVL